MTEVMTPAVCLHHFWFRFQVLDFVAQTVHYVGYRNISGIDTE
jgi:hypothetical protein